MRLPVLTSLFWTVILLCVPPCPAEDVLAEDPLGGRFWQTSGQQLADGTVIRTVVANSLIQCSMHCLGHEQCKAANFRPATGTGSDTGSETGSGNCDLLESQAGTLVDAEPEAVSLRLPGACRPLRKVGYKEKKDGVYRHRGLPAPLYCDMTLDGGGWTLLTSSVSTEGWTLDYVIERRRETPGIDINYSILGLGEQILSVGTMPSYKYRFVRPS